jgi:hypothetical protein
VCKSFPKICNVACLFGRRRHGIAVLLLETSLQDGQMRRCSKFTFTVNYITDSSSTNVIKDAGAMPPIRM